MKELPTKSQEEAVIAVDHLLHFIVTADWDTNEVKDLIIKKLKKLHIEADPSDKESIVFVEAALKYVQSMMEEDNQNDHKN